MPLPKGFEWVIILIVALLIFGPKNLPKLGSSLGKTVKSFRDGMGEGDEAAAKAQVAKADAEAAIDDGYLQEIRDNAKFQG